MPAIKYFYNALEGNGNINVCPIEQRNRLRPYYRAASITTMQNEYDRYDESLSNILIMLQRKLKARRARTLS